MTLRVLSYNILWGGEDRLPLIASVIKKQQPGFQKLQRFFGRNGLFITFATA